MLNSLIQNVQHRSLFIDTDLETFDERDVSDDHTEADRDEEQWLPVLQDRNSDEGDTDDDHDEVLPGHVRKSGIAPELLQAFKNRVHIMR